MVLKSVIDGVKGLKPPFSVIVVTRSESFNETLASLVKSVGRGVIVMVSFNRPSSSLESVFKGKARGSVFYVDLVTQVASGEPQKKENTVFLASQRNLTDLSITLSEVLNRLEGEKFVILDSLTTMLLYNDVSTTTQFLQFLANRLRLWNTSSFILTMEGKSEEEVIRVISQVVDKTIKV